MKRVFSLLLGVILFAGGAFCVLADTDTGDVADPAADPVEGEGSDPAADPVEVPEIVDDTAAGASGEGDLAADPVSAEESAASSGDLGSSGADPVSVDAVEVSELTVNADTVMLASLPEDNEYPSGAPLVGGVYMEVVTSQLGEVIIYVPVANQYKSFTYNTSGDPVNVTGSTITGYCYSGDDYYIRWTSFGQAQYRLVDGTSYGSSYSDLSITDVLNTNVVFIEGNDDLPVVPDADMLQIIMVFLVGGCLLCLFMKRL